MKSVDGIRYHEDSTALQALLLYNKATINSMCADILQQLIHKNQEVELVNSMQTVYGFRLSKDKLDSLAYYNIRKEDIGINDRSKPIFISGTEPYTNRGLYENSRIMITDFEERYPVLYKYATSVFLAANKPKLISMVTNAESTKYVDYDAEFQYTSGQAVYLDYSVKAEHQRIAVVLNKEEDQ